MPLSASRWRCAGVVAVLYGGVFTLWALKHEGQSDDKPGRAFSLVTALGLAATLAVILVASAALAGLARRSGLVIAAGIAGFADTHSPAVSAASLVCAEDQRSAGGLPDPGALTTNTITKIVLAFTGGSRAFAFSGRAGTVAGGRRGMGRRLSCAGQR